MIIRPALELIERMNPHWQDLFEELVWRRLDSGFRRNDAFRDSINSYGVPLPKSGQKRGQTLLLT